MTLARITLASGRGIELTRLEISSTYDGLLEGYPNKRMDDALLERLARRRGPVELLPAVCCRASFRSGCIDTELDPVLHRSWLVVAWFQEDLSGPVTEFVTAAVSGLAWEELAEDSELQLPIHRSIRDPDGSTPVRFKTARYP